MLDPVSIASRESKRPREGFELEPTEISAVPGPSKSTYESYSLSMFPDRVGSDRSKPNQSV
jgi:hypothetical protein